MSISIGASSVNAAAYRLEQASAAAAKTADTEVTGATADAAGIEGVEEAGRPAGGPPPGGRPDGPPPGGGRPDGPPPGQEATSGQAETDLASDLVDQLTASASFMANLNGVEAEDETLQALLNLSQ